MVLNVVIDFVASSYKKIWVYEILMCSYGAEMRLQDFICVWIIIKPRKPSWTMYGTIVLVYLKSM